MAIIVISEQLQFIQARVGAVAKADVDRLRSILNSMIARCYNPKSNSFEYYGARGIEVSEDWRKCRSLFVVWAFQNGYRKGLNIDRIDNASHYIPENCRFVSPSDNCNNRRGNRSITYDGQTMTISQWSRTVGINQHTLRLRLENGWSPQEVLCVPVGYRYIVAE